MDAETKWLIRKQIHASCSCMSSEDVWLERTVRLPAAVSLSVGMEICDGDWYSGPLKEIVYDMRFGGFRCFVEPNDELYYADLNKLTDRRSIGEIASGLIKDGWKHHDR